MDLSFLVLSSSSSSWHVDDDHKENVGVERPTLGYPIEETGDLVPVVSTA
jgi:hypothetical protein